MSTCQTDPATDDVAFARAIFEWMPEHLCLDRSRLFAMGFSNGGAMTFRLQCEFSHLLRAISVTGMRLARDWAPGGALCQPERLIPIVGFCGENDSCHNPSATQCKLPWVLPISRLAHAIYEASSKKDSCRQTRRRS